jgi:hypothetical protein
VKCEIDIWLIYKLNLVIHVKIISIIQKSVYDATFSRLVPNTLSDTQKMLVISLFLPYLTSGDPMKYAE